MEAVEFFKATSGGNLDPIEKSTSSLHNRRSIIIKDNTTQIIWLIQGSGAAESTKTSAEKSAKNMNAETGFQYQIKTPSYDTAEEVVENILSSTDPDKILNEKPTKPAKPSSKGIRQTVKTSVPRTPKVPKTSIETEQPLIEDDSGPEIEEFQIKYYKEEQEGELEEIRQAPSKIDTQKLKDILILIQSYVEEVDDIISNKPTKQEADNILSALSKRITDIIYE